MPEKVTPDQIAQVALRLFAEIGYDMTSIDLIADAVGVPSSVVNELTGGKRELYVRVMGLGFEEKCARVREALEGAPSAREAMHRFVDVYLDFYAENPRHLAMWTHRWVSDAADVTEIEDLYLRPLLRMVSSRIRDVVPEDIGPYGLLGVVLWSVSGFLRAGILAPGGHGMIGADDPEAMKYFRSIVHITIDRMLEQPRRP